MLMLRGEGGDVAGLKAVMLTVLVWVGELLAGRRCQRGNGMPIPFAAY